MGRTRVISQVRSNRRCRCVLNAGVIGVGVIAFGCDGGESGGRGDDKGTRGCAALTAALEKCDLLSAGRFDCNETYWRLIPCEIDCIERAPCGDLAGIFCGASAAVTQCMDQCAPDAAFQCSDGTAIDIDSRCDTFYDCQDESDEEGCQTSAEPLFECYAGGDVALRSDVCDLSIYCSDGSDEEQGCAKVRCPSE